MLRLTKDTLLIILQKLDDSCLENIFQVNKYLASLKEDESFWFNRLLNRFSPKKLKKLKAELSYREVYLWLYQPSRRNMVKIVKTDNLLLFRELNWINYKDAFYLACKEGSIEILSYLIINGNGESHMNSLLYKSMSPKAYKWLKKMDLINFYEWTVEAIRNGSDVHTVKKYYFKHYERYKLYQNLGESLRDDNVQSRKEIFELFWRFGQSKNDWRDAVTAAEQNYQDGIISSDTLLEWTDFIRDTVNNSQK